MKSMQRTDRNQQVLVALRTCITPRCDNATPSFYCDQCWEQLQPSSTPA
jgi:hypothetical protein